MLCVLALSGCALPHGPLGGDAGASGDAAVTRDGSGGDVRLDPDGATVDDATTEDDVAVDDATTEDDVAPIDAVIPGEDVGPDASVEPDVIAPPEDVASEPSPTDVTAPPDAVAAMPDVIAPPDALPDGAIDAPPDVPVAVVDVPVIDIPVIDIPVIDIPAIDVPVIDVPVIDVRIDTTPAAVWRVVMGTTSNTSWHGGDHGDADPLRCFPGELVVGLAIQHSQYVNALGLRCAALLPDGSFGPARTTDLRGGGNGSLANVTCPAGQALVRLEGRSGGIVDQLTPICAAVPAWYASGALGMNLGTFGQNGGSPWGDSCPARQMAYGLEFDTTYFDGSRRVGSVRMNCMAVTP